MNTDIKIEGLQGALPHFFIGEKRGQVVTTTAVCGMTDICKQQVKASAHCVTNIYFANSLQTDGTKVAAFGEN
ncbi:MAG TPA: hypothetical protein VLT16_00525 [Candidatus Limnocylindrales bacterium]|nr:hypothetical protein [Candidatus Limnocylindrales bacterium]